MTDEARTCAADEGREERLAEERFLLAAQVAIQKMLDEKGLRYRDLAKRLGVSEARVSQLFGDDATNLTIRTIARIFHRLDEKPILLSRREYDRTVAEAGREAAANGSAWTYEAGDTRPEDFDIAADIGVGTEPDPQTRRPASPRQWAEAEAAAERRKAA